PATITAMQKRTTPVTGGRQFSARIGRSRRYLSIVRRVTAATRRIMCSHMVVDSDEAGLRLRLENGPVVPRSIRSKPWYQRYSFWKGNGAEDTQRSGTGQTTRDQNGEAAHENTGCALRRNASWQIRPSVIPEGVRAL